MANIENIKKYYEGMVKSVGWENTAKEFSTNLFQSMSQAVTNCTPGNISAFYAMVGVGIVMRTAESRSKGYTGGKTYFSVFMDTGAEYLNLLSLAFNDKNSYNTIVAKLNQYKQNNGYHMAVRRLLTTIVGDAWFVTIPYKREELSKVTNGPELLQLFESQNVKPFDEVEDFSIFNKDYSKEIKTPSVTQTQQMSYADINYNISRTFTEAMAEMTKVSQSISKSLDISSTALANAFRQIQYTSATQVEKESIGVMGWIKKILKWLGIAVAVAVAAIGVKMLWDKVFGDDEYVEYVTPTADFTNHHALTY